MNRSVITSIVFLLTLNSMLVFANNIPKVDKLITTASGLQYGVIEQGTGTKVTLNKEVAFHWTGYLPNGEEFGSSRNTEPFYFITGKNQVIKGAEEALLKMRVGDRYKLIIPPQLAYGEKGSGDTIPPNATLIFDYQVMSVSAPKENIIPLLAKELSTKGIDEAVDFYKKMQQTFPKKYSYRENVLNGFGYKLLGKKQKTEAVAIFELNSDIYPNSWNVWDSLGDGYYQNQQWQKSLDAFTRSVVLNPESTYGIEMIDKLRTKLNKK